MQRMKSLQREGDGKGKTIPTEAGLMVEVDSTAGVGSAIIAVHQTIIEVASKAIGVADTIKEVSGTKGHEMTIEEIEIRPREEIKTLRLAARANMRTRAAIAGEAPVAIEETRDLTPMSAETFRILMSGSPNHKQILL